MRFFILLSGCGHFAEFHILWKLQYFLSIWGLKQIIEKQNFPPGQSLPYGNINS